MVGLNVNDSTPSTTTLGESFSNQSILQQRLILKDRIRYQNRIDVLVDDDKEDVKMGNTANDEEEEDSSDDDDEETQQLRSQSSAKRQRTEGQADL